MRLFRIIILSIILFSISTQSNSQYLKDIAPFPIGTALAMTIANDPIGGSIVMNEFNSITPEYQMKISTLNPNSKTIYDFTLADALVNYAQANNKRLHGHVLIQPISANMQWFQDMVARADPAEWDDFMKTRIETLINRYKNQGVKTWDVVNEAIADNGTLIPNIWYQMLGPSYIEKAFQYAHDADPEAKLFYNDYGHEFTGSTKVSAIVAMVNDFKTRGVPIHGLGLQMHTTIGNNKVNVENAIRTMAETGLLIHISEPTIEINRDDSQTLAGGPDALRLQQQKQKYKELVEAMQFIPPTQRFGLTFWGVSDKRSYPARPKAEWPVLWDDDFNKKPAYDGVVEGLQTLLTILPISCNTLSAKADKKGITVRWQTTIVSNRNTYYLYRSTNGIDFNLLAKIPNENAQNPRSYSYTDQEVNSNSNYYYRLKQENTDGTLQDVCDIVNAKWKSFNESSFIIYPNPVKDKLKLSTKISSSAIVQLFTVLGNKVYEQTYLTNNIEINTSHLLSGNYILKLINGSDIYTERFIKQN